jgi:hypothetical protein
MNKKSFVEAKNLNSRKKNNQRAVSKKELKLIGQNRSNKSSTNLHNNNNNNKTNDSVYEQIYKTILNGSLKNFKAKEKNPKIIKK